MFSFVALIRLHHIQITERQSCGEKLYTSLLDERHYVDMLTANKTISLRSGQQLERQFHHDTRLTYTINVAVLVSL